MRELPKYWDQYYGGRHQPEFEVETKLPGEELAELTGKVTTYPEGFHIHPKVKKLLEQRAEMGTGKRAVDYGMAEALAFASLVKSGIPVRLSGQDTRRGTFNQRHSVLIDIENENEYVPLENVAENQARCEIYNSTLSEAGVLGFDFRRALRGVGRANVIGINFPQRWMLFDPLVQQRLRDGGVVHFAVAVTAIADQVDHDVGAELVTIFHRHAAHAHHGVHVFAVDVKDWNRLAPRDARCEPRGMFFVIVSGESEKIVRDDVNRAAYGEAFEVGVVHGLGENSLPRKRRVAVHQKRQIGFAPAFAVAILFGARAPDGDRIHRFQMAGI